GGLVELVLHLRALGDLDDRGEEVADVLAPGDVVPRVHGRSLPRWPPDSGRPPYRFFAASSFTAWAIASNAFPSGATTSKCAASFSSTSCTSSPFACARFVKLRLCSIGTILSSVPWIRRTGTCSGRSAVGSAIA